MLQKDSLLKFVNRATGFIGVGMGMYHLIYTRWLMQDPLMHQNTHLILALLLVYLTTLKKKPKWWPYIFVLILASLVGTIYVFVNYAALAERAGIPTFIDVVMGSIIVLVVLEACRQSFGWVIPTIALIAMAYALLSSHLPPPFYHSQIDFSTVISWSAIALQGLYGTFLNISATFIILFLIFGGLLGATGISEAFMELGKAAGKKVRSGPGQTAVISSGLIGMVTGVGQADVAFTGPITIPIMKKAGYTPEQAGGIEAAVASGSAIMPPVMASAAFLMAGFLGISYGKIVLMAFIPGILYFICVGIAVHLLALRQGVTSNIKDIVNTRLIKNRLPIFVISLAIIIILLLMDFSAAFAAFVAICVVFVLSFIRKETRLTWHRLVDGFREGTTVGASIAVAIGCIGIIASMVSLTGVGSQLAFTVEAWSLGIPLLAIFICMVVTIILGCGMALPAVYALMAILVAPAMIKMGLGPIETHFFILYFACFSSVSPPVAASALLAAKIAGGSYFKTAFESMKVAACAFVIPWLILWNSNLIARFTGPLPAVATIFSTLILLFTLQAGLFGQLLTRLNSIERIALILISAILVVYIVTYNYIFLGIGLVLAAAAMAEQYYKSARARKAAVASTG